MSKKVPAWSTRRRLNLRALAILGAVLVAAVPIVVGINAVRDRLGRKAYLNEARKQIAAGKPALALGYLNLYLGLDPDDMEALDLKARVLFDEAATPGQAVEALKVHGPLLNARTDAPRVERAKRRVVRLNLRAGRAQAALEMARKLSGDDAEAHRLLALGLAHVGRLEQKPALIDEARGEYEKAEAREPGDVDTAEVLVDSYQRQDQPAKAREVLDHLVAATARVPRKHADALLARARLTAASRIPGMSEKDVEALSARAAADVERATRDDPGGIEPRLVAAELALQRHDADAARRHLAAIAKDQRDERRIGIIEGMIALDDQRPDEAVHAWRSALIRTGGNDAELTYKLATLLLELGRVADADPLIGQYRRLTGGEEPDPRYRYLHAVSLLRANRPVESAAELEAIRYKIDKSLVPQTLYSLGQAYQATRADDKAAEAFAQAAELSQGWSAPWTALARLQAGVGHPGEAIATLRKGLTQNPGDAQLLATQAQVLYGEQLKKPAEERSLAPIERLLNDAGAASRGSAEVAMIRAEYDLNTGQPENALSLLETATKLHPKSSELWVARANLLTRLGRPGDAEAVLREADRKAGPLAVIHVLRAAILAAKGDIAEARKALRDGLARLPDEQKPPVLKALGELETVRKDVGAAQAAIEQWAKLQPENPEPQLAQFRLALLRDDVAAIDRAIKAVRAVAGERGYQWRLARIETLLRDRDRTTAGKRLDEAERLVLEIEANDPQLALGYMLEGQVREARDQTDRAIAAYRKALDLGAGETALAPLVALLSRLGRDAELDRLAESVSPDQRRTVEHAAALRALAAGKSARAQELAEQAVRGDPRGLDARVWEAEVLRALGKPGEAEARARALTVERPTEPAPWLLVLMLQLQRDDKAGAAETVEQIRRKVKAEYPELLWAQCYRAVGDLRRAAECNAEAVRRWPNDPNVLIPAVTFYEQTGRRVEAEDTLRAILRRDPSSPWARQTLALSLAGRAGDRAAWNEALALVGDGPRPNDTTGDRLIRAGIYALSVDPADRRKAIEILEGVLAEQPERADLRARLGRLLLADGDAAKAYDQAARAAAGASAPPEAILFHADVLLARHDLDGAERELERVARNDPDGLAVAELKARIMAARGQASTGAEALVRAFDRRSAAADGWVVGQKAIQALLAIDQPEAAERIARRLVERSPRGRCILAELLAGRGQVVEAIGEVERAAREGAVDAAGPAALALAARPGADPRWATLAERLLAPTEANAGARPTFATLERLAVLYHVRGDFAREVETYRRMIEAGPPNHLFLNNLAWTLSEDLNRPADGLKYADEAVKRVGPRPNLLDTRGVILDRLGRHAEAVRDLEAAARGLNDPTVYYHLARAHVRMGNHDEARRNRARARDAGLVRDRLTRSERADWDAVMNDP